MAYNPRQWLDYGNYNTDDKQSNVDSYTSPYPYKPSQDNLGSFYDVSSSESVIMPSTNSYGSNSYINNATTKKRVVDEYDPAAPGFTGSTYNSPKSISSTYNKATDRNVEKETPDPRKLDHYITMLQKLIRPIP